MPGEDALFDGPRPPGVLLQEFFVVVCLDEQRVDPAQHFKDESRGITEIGEDAEAHASRRDAKAHRVSGVVRH